MSGLRKFSTAVFTTGAACALGFLSFVGMFAILPNLALCGAAAALAVAYEGQVYEEGIAIALRRLFSKNYLVSGIIRRYLEKFSEEDSTQNIFLKDYFAQKKYIDELEKIENKTAAQKIEFAKAKKRLVWMELFLYRQLQNTAAAENEMEHAARDLAQQDRVELLSAIQYRMWFLKIGGAFALLGGLASGLTALSSMQMGVAIFAGLSVIPGGVFVTFSALAAAGYALLLYQAMSDIALNYGASIKSYFLKKPQESKAAYVARCFLASIALVAGLVATIATAGTAWYAAKQGAEFFMSGGVASVVRTLTVAAMVVPNFIFSVTNSIDSVDDICNSDYKSLWNETKKSVVDAWRTESPWQFFNVFRALDRFLVKSSEALYLLGHVISIGVTSDRSGLRPEASVPLQAGSELFEDLAYRPGKKSEEPSKLLRLMMAPVWIAVFVLRGLAIAWDVCSTGDLQKSVERMSGDVKKTAPEKQKAQPVQPELSAAWRKQEVLEVCHDISARLCQEKNSVAVKKLMVAADVCQKVKAGAVIAKTDVEPLAKNRCSWWRKKEPQSMRDMANALENYARPSNGW